MERCPPPLPTPALDAKQLARLLSVIEEEAPWVRLEAEGSRFAPVCWKSSFVSISSSDYDYWLLWSCCLNEFQMIHWFYYILRFLSHFCTEILDTQRMATKYMCRFLGSITLQVLPKTAQGVKEGNKVFGAAVLRPLALVALCRDFGWAMSAKIPRSAELCCTNALKYQIIQSNWFGPLVPNYNWDLLNLLWWVVLWKWNEICDHCQEWHKTWVLVMGVSCPWMVWSWDAFDSISFFCLWCISASAAPSQSGHAETWRRPWCWGDVEGYPTVIAETNHEMLCPLWALKVETTSCRMVSISHLV